MERALAPSLVLAQGRLPGLVSIGRNRGKYWIRHRFASSGWCRAHEEA